MVAAVHNHIKSYIFDTFYISKTSLYKFVCFLKFCLILNCFQIFYRKSLLLKFARFKPFRGICHFHQSLAPKPCGDPGKGLGLVGIVPLASGSLLFQRSPTASAHLWDFLTYIEYNACISNKISEYIFQN